MQRFRKLIHTVVLSVVMGVLLTVVTAGAQSAPTPRDEQLQRKEQQILREIQNTTSQRYDPANPAAQNQGATAAPPPQNLLFVGLRIGFVLLLVVGLVVGVGWFVRKFGLAGSGASSGGNMEVLEMVPLGQNQSLVLVRVADTVYLLGRTPQQVSSIAQYGGEQALELISNSRGGVSMMQFKDVFNSFMGKVRKSS
jgi:flagellar biosynthetic protein FliO